MLRVFWGPLFNSQSKAVFQANFRTSPLKPSTLVMWYAVPYLLYVFWNVFRHQCFTCGLRLKWTTEIELTDYWWFRFQPLLRGHFIGYIYSFHEFIVYGFLSSSRQHLNSDDCPKDTREDYQNCSVLCCVPLTVVHSHKHIHISTSYKWIRACSYSFRFVCDFFVCFFVTSLVCFCVHFFLGFCEFVHQ